MLCAHCLSEDPRRREQIKVRLHAWPSARDLSLHGSKLQFAPDLFLSHLTSIPPPGWPHLDSANQADGRTTYVCSCSPVCFPCPFICSSLLLLVVFSPLSFSCSLPFWADVLVCLCLRIAPDNLAFFEPQIDNTYARHVFSANMPSSSTPARQLCSPFQR